MRFPDVDQVLATWVHHRVPDVDVSGSRPADTEWGAITRPLVVVQVTDTGMRHATVLTTQSFLVEVWAPDSVVAFDAAADVAEELGYLPGLQDDVPVYSCDTSAPRHVPDPDAGVPRYQVVGQITCRMDGTH